MPASDRFTMSTCCAWSSTDRLRCSTPAPPWRAMATAIRASVTVSMAAETSGTRSVMRRLSEAGVSASPGMTAEWAGSSSTSSKVRAGGANLAPSVMSPAGSWELAMFHPSDRRARHVRPGRRADPPVRAPPAGRGAAWTEERATKERATKEGGASKAPRRPAREARPAPPGSTRGGGHGSRRPSRDGSAPRGSADPGGLRRSGQVSGDPLLAGDLPEPGQGPVLCHAHRSWGHAECVAGLLGRQAGAHAEHQELALMHGEPGEQRPRPLGLDVRDNGLLRPGAVIRAVGQVLGGYGKSCRIPHGVGHFVRGYPEHE